MWSRNWMKFWWYSDFFSHFTQSTALLSQWRKAHWRKEESANVFTLDVFTECIHTGCIHWMYSHWRKEQSANVFFCPVSQFWQLTPEYPIFHIFWEFFLGTSLQWFDGKISTPFTQSLWGSLLKNLTKLFCPVCFVLSWNGIVFLVCFVLYFLKWVILYFLKWVRCKTQFVGHFSWDPVLTFCKMLSRSTW